MTFGRIYGFIATINQNTEQELNWKNPPLRIGKMIVILIYKILFKQFTPFSVSTFNRMKVLQLDESNDLINKIFFTLKLRGGIQFPRDNWPRMTFTTFTTLAHFIFFAVLQHRN